VAGAPPASSWLPSSPCLVAGPCEDDGGPPSWTSAPAGTLCDDGIACTVDDACNGTGACVGALLPSCDPLLCDDPVALPATLDVPMALVTGAITFGGQAPAALNAQGGNPVFWLVARDTGLRHRLEVLSYDWGQWEGKYQYKLESTGSFSRKVIPGVYDVLYQRNLPSSGEWVYDTEASDTLVNGYRYVAKDVVIGQGANLLDIDVPLATVSGAITFGGVEPPPLNVQGGNPVFWLVAKDTGLRHRLHTLSYDWGQWEGKYQYKLSTSASFSRKVIPGIYDVLYQRNLPSSGEWVYETEATDTLVNGYRILAEDVVIDSGANTLDIDVPLATVSGAITFGGSEPPPFNVQGGSPVFWLVAKDTGLRHRLHTLSYDWGQWEGKYQYKLDSPTTLSRKVIPGTYDVLYQRNLPSSGDWVYDTEPTDTLVNGYRLLAEDVVIGVGANTVDIDVPLATLSGDITIGGAAPPSLNAQGGSPVFWLVAKDTGLRHRLVTLSYDWGQWEGKYQYKLDAPSA
jgi:hypothetical protein